MDKLLHAGSTRGFQQRRHHLRIEVEITVVNPHGTHHDVDASTAQSARNVIGHQKIAGDEIDRQSRKRAAIGTRSHQDHDACTACQQLTDNEPSQLTRATQHQHARVRPSCGVRKTGRSAATQTQQKNRQPTSRHGLIIPKHHVSMTKSDETGGHVGKARFIWAWVAIALFCSGRVAAAPLPNDPMEPIASARGALAGPLSGAIVVSRDLDGLRRAYVDGVGLQMRGPLPQAPTQARRQRKLWGWPDDLPYDLYTLQRANLPDAIKVLVIVPTRDTPVMRKTWDREETGPYALGFPLLDVDAVDRRMIGLGLRRTLPAVNHYELQLRDGTPYPITEASYEIPDATRLVLLSRGGGLPQNGSVDTRTGLGGPAYSSLIVEDAAAMEDFFCNVLDFERRTSRDWTIFAPRFRYVTLHARGARTGNLGLVEYAPADRKPGTGIAPRPPNRGIAAWSFPVRSLATVLARAKQRDAAIQSMPVVVDDPRFGRVRMASLLAPNGLLVEVYERR